MHQGHDISDNANAVEIIYYLPSAAMDFNDWVGTFESLPLEDLSVEEKAKLYKILQKKLGFDALAPTQVLGGTQLVGVVQFNVFDKEALRELITALIENFGQEAAIEVVKAVIAKL